MKVHVLIFVLSLLCASFSAFAQGEIKMDSFSFSLKKAKTPERQVKIYYKFADDIFLYNPALSDSLAFAGYMVAEVSRDRKLIVSTLLRDADRYMQNFSVPSNITSATAQVQKAFTLAKTGDDPTLLLACHNKFARLYRGTGEPLKALQANAEAIALLPDVTDDSLKIVTYNNYGQNLFQKDDMLGCFKEYLNALTIAEQSNRKDLINICYSQLAEFYESLRDFEKAKDYAFKILRSHMADRDGDRVLDDYLRIGEIYSFSGDIKMGFLYYTKASRLADSLKNSFMELQGTLGIINMYLNNNKFKEGYELLRRTPQILSLMNSSGMQFEMDRANGYIQMKLGHYDSSFYFFRKAEPHYVAGSGSNTFSRFNFYQQFSTLYSSVKNWDSAIAMELRAQDAIIKTGHLESQMKVLARLDTLYFKKGDFNIAYQYHAKAQVYRDSLEKLSKEKDLQNLEIDNENKRKERETVLAAAELDRRHNLQYLAITVVIGGIFILLVVLGLLKVSTAVVKAMGFFAFIFLFEFIILIADNQIHHLTHGEPWKVLLIKIGLIAVLLPFHHWLEERVVHLLITNRLQLAERLGKLRSKPAPPRQAAVGDEEKP